MEGDGDAWREGSIPAIDNGNLIKLADSLPGRATGILRLLQKHLIPL
jgi:hypothetical protein